MKRVFGFIWRLITAPFRGLTWVFRRITAPLTKAISFFSDPEQDKETPITEVLGNVIQQPATLLPHIAALRKHIFRSLLVVFLLSALTFTMIKPIMAFLSHPLPGGLASLIAVDITENVSAVMKVAVLTGFAVSIPYVAFETWFFFAPAISPGSRFNSLLAIPLALIFFLAGMSFAYFIMLPVALPFLFNFMDLSTQPRPSSYFNFVTAIMFWIGIFFEFPLVAFLLARIGVLRSETLRSQWRLAIIIMAVLAAAVTPTVDPINMGVVMAPMVLLYLLAIVFAAIAQKRRQANLA